MCFVPSGTALSSLQTGRGERAWTPKRTYIQALPLGTHRWLSFLLKGPRLESSCRQVAKSGSPLWARPSLQMIEHKARAEGKVALRKKKKKSLPNGYRAQAPKEVRDGHLVIMPSRLPQERRDEGPGGNSQTPSSAQPPSKSVPEPCIF